MKKQDRHYRISLILLVSATVFIIILVAIFLSALLVSILVDFGVLHGSADLSDTRTLVTVMGAVSIFLGIVITALLSRLTLSPVNRVINRLNRLAAGQFKTRLNFGKPIGLVPAFSEICTSFNKLAEELENTEMLRSDFINNFSHEFKTPIVSVAGFAKLLRTGNLPESKQKEYLKIIEDESLRLAQMANDVLTLTKCENQQILSNITKFNLSEQIRASILALESKWSKKNVEFNLGFGEITVSANRELLNNIWINLIDNAIKFSPVNSTIDISACENGENIAVTVTNYGSEIPLKKQNKIFNKFYQADESHSSEGNGIGLALVKCIISLHSGTVSVTSENNITSFTVTLPKG